jgi:hypothetical protein
VSTPDPRPEARAQAWDDQVERVAETLWRFVIYDSLDECIGITWPDSAHVFWPFDKPDYYRHMAAAALKVIQAERAGEAEGEWEWGFRWPEWPDNVDSRWVDSEWQARALVAEVPGRVLVRRIPAGRWEPAPAEGGA